MGLWFLLEADVGRRGQCGVRRRRRLLLEADVLKGGENVGSAAVGRYFLEADVLEGGDNMGSAAVGQCFLKAAVGRRGQCWVRRRRPMGGLFVLRRPGTEQEEPTLVGPPVADGVRVVAGGRTAIRSAAVGAIFWCTAGGGAGEV